MEQNKVTLETIVALAKRRGFVFPGSEIYGGLAGTFDYGPMGAVLKENIKNLWWRMFVDMRDDMYRLDAAILMNPKAWEASGHVSGFSDPLIECRKCHQRQRVDQLVKDLSEYGEKINAYSAENTTLQKAEIGYSSSISFEDMSNVIQAAAKFTGPIALRYFNEEVPCPVCGAKDWVEPKQFNMMFSTKAGAAEDESATVYLRPETAGGIFVNFKNVVDSMHPKLPFGIAQIGKAFRNEIAPRDFIFRLRELEQMEIEYFVKESAWKDAFEMWQDLMHSFAKALGLAEVHELEVEVADLAHYSKRTIDFEFEYPFGRKELWGLAYRTDFDLKAHQEASGAKLEYLDEESKEKFIPHVIEPSLGVDRTLLAVLVSAYREDNLGGETRSYLALPPSIAPVKAMVAPLLKNKPELVAKAREVRAELQKVHPAIAWDDNGNIGKRYRRQDEIGTPFCITIDFDTLGENTELLDSVTLRHRDSGEQERVTIAEAAERIRSSL